MSNDEYQHKTFCQEVNMRNKPKITFSIFPGICLGISFPMSNYQDIVLGILCFGITIKYRKK